jgi:putative ABC transport system permease protein
MAYSNVFREKKRALMVFASLFMGIMTLLLVNGFMGNVTTPERLATMFTHDFTLSSYNVDENIFGDDIVSQLESIQGIEHFEAVPAARVNLNFDEELFRPWFEGQQQQFKTWYPTYEDLLNDLKNTADFGTYVRPLSRASLEAYNKASGAEIDIDRFERGESVIIDNGTKIGNLESLLNQELRFTNPKTGAVKNVAIGGFYEGSDEEMRQIGGLRPGEFRVIYVSENFMNEFVPNANISLITVDVDAANEPEVRAQLTQLTRVFNGPEFRFSIPSEYIASMKAQQSVFLALGNTISLIFVFIGIVNLTNVMLTNVQNRRQEFAVLESIGMTKKQIGKMLTYEGFYYALITSLLLATVGSGMLFGFAKLTALIEDYPGVRYSFSLAGLMLLVLFAICLLVPKALFKSVSRESITTRLRQD